jgi:hypothetical protein
MSISQKSVEQVLASFTPAQMIALADNELTRPYRELCKILAKYGPSIKSLMMPGPATEQDRYDEALEIQQTRRSFRIVRPDEEAP